jgi:hypothetical protein
MKENPGGDKEVNNGLQWPVEDSILGTYGFIDFLKNKCGAEKK